MRLKISHTTQYAYDGPVPYALQRLRLCPQSSRFQEVIDWRLDVLGANEEVRFSDQFGNDTRLFSISGGSQLISITAAGEIEVKDNAGVSGPHSGYAPLWMFEHQTPLTSAGEQLREIARGVDSGADLDRLHHLSAIIRERVAYEVGVTDASTTAEEALIRGMGVCQDHSHIFLTCARMMGFPARYVSGYLLIDGTTEQAATHAWAEAHVAGLGWVAFDISNGIAPDGRYVRLAVGRDYRDAMPISGIRLGRAQEHLEVHITVEQ
jgi:transglutaminase-like putative cysteine protease